MHVFVATSRTQGARPDDFCWTVEGELVQLPMGLCSCPDCGCDRSMSGLSSSKATTTFTVEDRPDLDTGTLETLFRDTLEREGWIALFQPDEVDVAGLVRLHTELASSFVPGRVLEMRGTTIVERDPSP